MNRLLNESQLKAVETIDQNVVVRAGAGTGKTTVLVERFVKLIADRRASCNEILAITFTDKAANEMKKRLVLAFQSRGLTDARREIENSYIGTIHAFCSRVLKEHPIEAGMDPNFQVLREEEANLLMGKALDQLFEDRFLEPGVNHLLRSYSEKRIRKELKSFRDIMLMHERANSLDSSDFTFKMAKLGSGMPDEVELKESLLKSLSDLALRERQRIEAEDAIGFLNQSFTLDWESIERLEMLNKKIDLKGKTKDKAQAEIVREVFETYIQFQIGKIGISYQTTFLDLLSDFSKRYEVLKTNNACLDFLDLEQKTIQLLSSDHPAGKAVREHYKRQFKFMMVDEFQDVDSLEFELINLLKGENNLFVVGDEKQSIYGFRGSNPEIFKAMAKTAQDSGNTETISLAQNFRTHKETLNFVNSFCNELWQEETFYQPLEASRKFEKTIELPVDLIRIEQSSGESLDETRLSEASVIAGRIQELMKSENYEYRDFALLFRSGTGIQIYEQALQNAQIPYYLIGGEGFYTRPEICDVLNVLRILENPKKDIPLAAVLRSPMFRLSDDTLFWISKSCKSTDKRNALHLGLVQFESIMELSEPEKDKIRRFWKLFYRWFSVKEKISAAELIEQILSDTHYDLYVLGLSQGKRQYANLKKLIDFAREIHVRDALHLGDFIRLVEGFETHEAREAEAQVQAEKGNVVRLMTIHKAKGLEFKCVILPDLSRAMPRIESAFLFSSKFGMGLKVHTPKTGELKHSLAYAKICEELRTEKIEESKRLLYVALTRTEERLILSGVVKENNSSDDTNEKKSSHWFDWVLQIKERCQLQCNQIEHVEAPLKYSSKRAPAQILGTWTKLEQFQPLQTKLKSISKEVVLNQLKTPEIKMFERIDLPVSAYHAFLRDDQHEEYRLVYEVGAQSSNLELKNEEPPREDLPSSISSTQFGILVHSVFESLVHQRTSQTSRMNEIIQFFARYENEEVREELEKAASQFLDLPLFSKIKEAKNIFSEIPFSLRLKHGIIHGVLDLLYQEQNGDWIIVDYKTSRISPNEIEAKAREYQLQMELYALACRQILDIEPKCATLYFTVPNQTYDFAYRSEDFATMSRYYEELQRSLIDFRKDIFSPNI